MKRKMKSQTLNPLLVLPSGLATLTTDVNGWMVAGIHLPMRVESHSHVHGKLQLRTFPFSKHKN